RQRTRLSEQTFPRRLPRLRAPSGVHPALHARAKWHDRALLPKSEGGVRLDPAVPALRRGAARDRPMDPLVQRRSTASSTRLSQPDPVSGSTTQPGGLTSREHYSRSESAQLGRSWVRSSLLSLLTESCSMGGSVLSTAPSAGTTRSTRRITRHWGSGAFDRA